MNNTDIRDYEKYYESIEINRPREMFYSIVVGNGLAAFFSFYFILFQIIRSPHKQQQIYQIALVTTTLYCCKSIRPVALTSFCKIGLFHLRHGVSCSAHTANLRRWPSLCRAASCFWCPQ